MHATCLPRDTNASAWQVDQPATKPHASITPATGSHSARFAVIGAGFTGLAAARRLARLFPQESIALIDALTIGQGAAGRNCGFVVPIGHFPRGGDSLDSEKRYRLGLAGIRELRQTVDRYRIDCDWQNSGRLIAARSRSGLRALDHKQRVLEQLGAPVELLDGRQVAALTGMSGYLRAIVQKDAALVNPAALVRGLLQNLPANIQVFQRSPVLRLRPGKRVHIDCGQAEISAEHVLLTTNGWLGSLRSRGHGVFPMRTFASLAEPMNQLAPQERLGAGRWGLTSSLRVGSSLRRLSRNRILIRNSAAFGWSTRQPQRELKRIAEKHKQCLAERFPGRGPWTIQRTWSGVLGITANGAGYFGQAADNIWAAAGHNGHGIAHGTAVGWLLADIVGGRSSDLLDDVRALPRPVRVPAGPWLRGGVAVSAGFLNWHGRREI